MTVLPAASVVKLAAFTVPAIVVVPLLVKVKALTAFVAPRAALKLMAPEPVFTVRLRGVVVALSTVEAKLTLLLVVVKLVLAPRITASL